MVGLVAPAKICTEPFINSGGARGAVRRGVVRWDIPEEKDGATVTKSGTSFSFGKKSVIILTE